jgi:ubiquinone/menaquinone biosynthesis C-methylase UbiE
MNQEQFLSSLGSVFSGDLLPGIEGNFLNLESLSSAVNQRQTNDAFTDKWSAYNKSPEKDKTYEMQRKWYLQLYGFDSECKLAEFLRSKKIIFDAGCGLGYKAAWFAQLAPDSLVIGMDFSDAAKLAADIYKGLDNLFFIQGDISRTRFLDGIIDYVSCDQVIMHTQNPDETFAELSRIIRPKGGEVACYFYSKKALPRELLDEHFRSYCSTMTSEELWQMSEQLTDLGKRLSELNVCIDAPDIPALGIKGGSYDLQRFIYWNFIKCFWNPELGKETSVVTNYDWYSPSNARRYSEEEVRALLKKNGLEATHFHQEKACHSGRFVKRGSTQA